MPRRGLASIVLLLTAAVGCQSLAARPTIAQSPAPGTAAPAPVQSSVPVTAQAPAQASARIVTTVTEEFELSPDRAMLSLAVETQAKTASAAGSENARIQTAVLDTLRKLGIANAQLRTLGFALNPEYEYPRDGTRPRLAGYKAQNIIQVEVRTLSAVGSIIDAGLAKGATSVGSLRFFASSTEEAVRDALKRAVAKARVDADAVAEAAGGRIDGVVEITVLSAAGGRPGPELTAMAFARTAQAMDVATPVEGGSLRMSVSVEARFSFAAR